MQSFILFTDGDELLDCGQFLHRQRRFRDKSLFFIIRHALSIAFNTYFSTLKYGGFHIVAENRAEDIHKLSQRGIGFDGLDQRRHSISSSFSGPAQIIQSTSNSRLIALLAYMIEANHVGLFALVINVERRHLHMFGGHVVVDTNDAALMPINLLLIAIG